MESITSTLRGLIKAVFFLFYLSVYVITSLFIAATTRDRSKRRRRFSANASRYCGLIARNALGIKLTVINKPAAKHAGSLLVANHMGFVDILLLAGIEPMSFITSNEMRETPLLGPITELAGCFYVERRSRTKILGEMKRLADSLKDGLNIVLYPEATSTNGEKVLPFKRTLMMAASEAGVPVQPVVINFTSINGEAFNTRWRDAVCWYGDATFVEYFWKTLRLKSVTAEIEYLEILHAKPEDERGALADKAHAMISAKFVPVQQVPPAAEQLPTDLETDPT
ncbi:1-acyl-sn-glycerol-3-phosphate acyltransferase [Bdellovibrio sp. ZAP7]|uniref:lysophospholipid acyltransferase family protein n=1 Tax=Bdellovibrio sp. ZAP7 TaxID=2231053 RepID=UPI001FEEC5BC|nr:1-acyl-sn-glycerol-3-phosphate acyltransferase [Bdellovibrio sp. ZAP7]